VEIISQTGLKSPLTNIPNILHDFGAIANSAVGCEHIRPRWAGLKRELHAVPSILLRPVDYLSIPGQA